MLKSGMPDSSRVGTSSSEVRRLLVVASAVSLPALMYDSTLEAGENITGTSPGSTSFMAWELPL